MRATWREKDGRVRILPKSAKKKEMGLRGHVIRCKYLPATSFFLLEEDGDYIGQVTMWLRMVGAVTPWRMRCEASTRPTQSSMA